MRRSDPQRLARLLDFDRVVKENGGTPGDGDGLQLKLFARHYQFAIGVDEVGRGCLAGPVMAAAVVLPEMESGLKESLSGLNDSKQLTAMQRQRLSSVLKEVAFYGIGYVSPEEIDSINILNASLLAMRRAVINLQFRHFMQAQKTLLIVDGKRALSDLPFSQLPVPEGDCRSACVAAASIIAKVERDELMRLLASDYPGYGFESNKGYPSRAHMKSLGSLGPTPVHRLSFSLGA